MSAGRAAASRDASVSKAARRAAWTTLDALALVGLLAAALVALGAPRAASVLPRARSVEPPPVASEPVPPRQSGPTGPLALALEPLPVQQGGQVRVSGRGFSSGEAVVIRASDEDDGPATLDLGRAHAGPSGTLEGVALELPEALGSGPHALEAVGQASGRRSEGVLWVRANAPWIVLSAGEVNPNEELGLIAGGFESGEQALVSLEPPRTPAAADRQPRAEPSTPLGLVTLPTDRVGNSEWSQVKLQRIRPGAYTLVARGESSGLELRRELRIKPFSPVVELSPWAGPPGVKIELNARGFAPGELVRVYVGDDARPAAEPHADQSGNLWGAGPVRAPQDAPPGRLLVTLTGEESGARVVLEFKVLEPKPWLELSSWWGPPGAPVGFSGGGWAAGERIGFHVGSASGPQAASGQADDFGWLRYAGPVYAPIDADREVTFVAVGERSGARATATYKVVHPFGLKPQPAPTPAPSR